MDTRVYGLETLIQWRVTCVLCMVRFQRNLNRHMLHSQKHYISIDTSLAQTLGSSYTKKARKVHRRHQNGNRLNCSSIATVVFRLKLISTCVSNP